MVSSEGNGERDGGHRGQGLPRALRGRSSSADAHWRSAAQPHGDLQRPHGSPGAQRQGLGLRRDVAGAVVRGGAESVLAAAEALSEVNGRIIYIYMYLVSSDSEQ